MRLLPRTLFGQVLLALFAGLIAAQTAGFWLMLDERARFGQRLLGGTAVQRIAGAISILDRAAPADRPRLLDALDVPPLELSLGEAWRPALRDVPDDVQQLLQRMSHELERPADLQVVAMRHADPHARPRHGETIGEPHRPLPPGPPLLFIEGQARLRDGAILTFRHGVRQPPPDWPHRLLMLLVLLGVSVALLSGWTVRRLTRPLAALADAASGLAKDLERPPLPESDPLEVARTAQAFNAMQRDLQREDRGPGIPAEERERVFEPYVRLERSRAKHTGGSGLGLAIARTIARGHGGDVCLFPREGGGTCALLTLPLPQAGIQTAA
jgi:hypothetical protein